MLQTSTVSFLHIQQTKKKINYETYLLCNTDTTTHGQTSTMFPPMGGH